MATSNSTALLAVVGATDLAVERVRAAAASASAVQAQFEARMSAVQADVEKRVNDFDAKALRNQAQDLPVKAAGRALEVAGKAEAAYEELAKRGQELIDRVRSQASTQDLLSQAGSTLTRGKAAVTVARKAADDTATAIRGTLNVGRREATTVVEDTRADTQTAVHLTQVSARKTAATTRKRAAATKSTVKGVQTSATRTAAKASTAARAAAKKTGK